VQAEARRKLRRFMGRFIYCRRVVGKSFSDEDFVE
jgi:hypothetical protein